MTIYEFGLPVTLMILSHMKQALHRNHALKKQYQGSYKPCLTLISF